MEIDRSQISSPLFELVRTVEFDVTVGETDIPLRVELFRATEDETLFRARLWEKTSVRLVPTQPPDERGEPTEPSDEDVPVERSAQLSGDYEAFVAPDAEAALQIVLRDLAGQLDYWSGEEPGPGHPPEGAGGAGAA